MATKAPGTRGDGRGTALRRYPALVWLVAAGVLALLLPSGLTLPQSGPSTLAEYAPVPGAGEGTSDVGELASTESGGIGSGSGRGERGAGGGDDAEPGGSGGRLVRKAGTKRCVGEPPRQTEDPTSPPCIAFFDGDNFGPTARGVTHDEVVVTVQMANTTANNDRATETECSEPYTGTESLIDAICKGYWKFFNDRYQTYNRNVRLISTGKNNRAALREKYGPFANVETGNSSDWARAGVLNVGFTGQRRSAYAESAPLNISFRPDSEDETAMVGSYICDRLAGRAARYAGDPTMRTRQREFGIIYYGGTENRRSRLKADVQARCGLTIDMESADNPTTTASLTRLRAAGVTTIITITANTGHAVASNNATQIGYFPEWFVYPAGDLNGIDVNFHARVANQAQWANAFGLTLDYRRGGLREQPWYRAYREGCPQCPEPTLGGGSTVLFAASMYDALAMLFYGVQSAGPRLTVENIDKGLHAIPPRASDDPFRPAAYFAPGNWSFLKDAMPIWWDPSGQAPGSPAAGCYRLPQEGRRYRASEWPAGDDLVKSAGPCQGDTFVG